MRECKGSVGIVGLGLIGGSLGLDLRALGWSVQGLVHRTATAERALERGLVDAVSTDPLCLSACDLVILALPIPALLAPDSTLLKALPRSAVVTDVGSVKQPVLEVWRSLHPRFVPSHPMAGTASAGVEAGQVGLFRGRPWIATPEDEPPVIMIAPSFSIMRFADARAASDLVCVSPVTKATFLPLTPLPLSSFDEKVFNRPPSPSPFRCLTAS